MEQTSSSDGPAVRRILLGTANVHKQREIAGMLAGLPVDLLAPGDLDSAPGPPAETGRTFEENARAKALWYARAAGMPALADDSGLEVDALGGRPGVHSARFAGAGASDEENNARLLRELEGVPQERRTARYTCFLVLAGPEGVLAGTRGSCEGRILETPRGEGGFGYDPLFLVPGLGCTFGEIPQQEKDAHSHRGRALRRMRDVLQRLLEGARGP